MNQITALREGKSRIKRIQVSLDGRWALSLEPEVALTRRLHVGQKLTPEEVTELSCADQRCRSLDAALHYLEYRPRSEAEVRGKLRQRGFSGEAIEATMVRLRETGLVDDQAFAQFWKENRDTFRPRSQWLTKMELRRKGVAGEIVEQVVGQSDDSENAYQAAQGKARHLAREDYDVFRQRLGDYLRRRGFSYEVSARTVARLWQERGSA
jgi:regulatory protein